MSLVTIINVSLHFPGKQIFNGIGFQVEPTDRIGLVGPNGSGKTTLLRLIKGEIPADSGEVRMAKGIRIGYLPQDVQEVASGSLLESVLEAVPGRKELQRERSRLEQDLNRTSDKKAQERLAEKLAEVHQGIHEQDTAFPPHEAEKILLGLGFAPSDFTSSVSSFSGGWKMRAVLASLLYQKPDLLLLDEPTNHLDIPSVRWLDKFLHDFRGALILVSHDRDFLNRHVGRIISFEPEGVRLYTGNYDFYVQCREEERRTLEARARNQEQKIKEAQKFIEKFRAKASKARQAQSKIKLVKKMAIVETPRKEKAIHFTFPQVPRSGRKVVTLKGVSKRFDKKPLYRDVNLTVLRGDRIAVIGPNGSGKTTLLKMIAGEIEPSNGVIQLGHGVSISYFAQHHSDMLDPRKTVIEEVYQVVPSETIGFVRNVCGAFLFSGQDVEKPVGVLSGGERARVSLAKLLVRPGNLMVMDEPTNHLDITSSEKLIDALEGYGGTLLFVSHNLSFINRLARKIWDIREGDIIEYPGNLNEYYDHLSRMEKQETEAGPAQEMRLHDKPAEENQDEIPPQKPRDRKEERRARAQRRQIVQETLKPILNALERLEEKIEGLESRQKELEKTLADPEIFKDKERSVPLLNEYNANQEELENLISEWEKRHISLESAKKRLGV